MNAEKLNAKLFAAAQLRETDIILCRNKSVVYRFDVPIEYVRRVLAEKNIFCFFEIAIIAFARIA